jgi:hypothetical protein
MVRQPATTTSTGAGAAHLRVAADNSRRPVAQQIPQQMPPQTATQYFTMPQAINPQILMQQQQTAQASAPVSEPAPAPQAYAPPVAPSLAQQPTPQVRASEPRAQASAYSPRPAMPPPQTIRPAAPPQSAAHASVGHAPFDVRVTQLTTPAQQASADQRRMRRSESLFTRITGFGLVRPSAQRPEEEMAEAALPDEIAGEQPHLGIDPADRPALSSEQPADLLDIPAFLRRQTNH